MKRRSLSRISVAIILSLVFALSFNSLVLAADLNPSQIGSSCAPGETGTWHFVNNRTGGAAPGMLTATFGDAGTISRPPSSVLQNTQHFYITGPTGPLLNASTNLPGGLVLSDLTCTPGTTETPTKTPEPTKTPDPTKTPEPK